MRSKGRSWSWIYCVSCTVWRNFRLNLIEIRSVYTDQFDVLLHFNSISIRSERMRWSLIKWFLGSLYRYEKWRKTSGSDQYCLLHLPSIHFYPLLFIDNHEKRTRSRPLSWGPRSRSIFDAVLLRETEMIDFSPFSPFWFQICHLEAAHDCCSWLMKFMMCRNKLRRHLYNWIRKKTKLSIKTSRADRSSSNNFRKHDNWYITEYNCRHGFPGSTVHVSDHSIDDTLFFRLENVVAAKMWVAPSSHSHTDVECE